MARMRKVDMATKMFIDMVYDYTTDSSDSTSDEDFCEFKNVTASLWVGKLQSHVMLNLS